MKHKFEDRRHIISIHYMHGLYASVCPVPTYYLRFSPPNDEISRILDILQISYISVIYFVDSVAYLCSLFFAWHKLSVYGRCGEKELGVLAKYFAHLTHLVNQ